MPKISSSNDVSHRIKYTSLKSAVILSKLRIKYNFIIKKTKTLLNMEFSSLSEWLICSHICYTGGFGIL